jgi:pimeloyl-ACP methyl ester carboxylesterase
MGVAAWMRRCLAFGRGEAVEDWFVELTDWISSRCQTSTTPIAGIVGDQDRIIPPNRADGLPASVRVTRLAGAGHIPHMEKSAGVNQAVRANIAQAG